MLNKIRDIQKALEAKAYLSALALALTLPDICGKIAYPDMNKRAQNGDRYARWFDEHLTQYDYPPDFENKLKFDGKKCWKLRCAFLHEGSIERVPDVDQFELSITKSEMPGIYGASSYGITQWDDVPCTYHIRLDVAQLCFQICSCAKEFYNTYEDKSVFSDQHITIIDINAEIEKIRKMNKHLYD